jgi:hypothetical protein
MSSRYCAEVDSLPAQQRDDALNCSRDLDAWLGFTRVAKLLFESHARRGGVARGEMNADNATVIPGDAADSERRVEESKRGRGAGTPT